MPLALPATEPRSLAAVLPGDRILLGCILFDAVRERCASLGLRPGTIVRCREAGPTLILVTDAGRVARLERRWARFVEALDAGTPLRRAA